MALQYLQPTIRAIDSSGNPMSGAKLYFYLTGTTTPTDTYNNPDLAPGHANANPVVADSGGLFGPIYLSASITYRAILKSSAGVEQDDIDPLIFGPAAATQGEVNTGTEAGKYVSPSTLAGADDSIVTGILGYTPVNKAGDTATALNITRGTTPATNAAGFLGLPVTTLDSSSDLALSAVGGMVRHTSSSAHTWTLQPVATIAHAIGATYNLRNYGSGVVTLTKGTGVTLISAGSGSSANKSLAQYAWATVTMEDTNIWVISGTGVT